MPDHISFCQGPSGVILLDLRRDWYFQLDPALEPAFRALVHEDGASPDRERVQQLMTLGVIEHRSGLATRLKPPAVTPAAASWRDQAPPSRASFLFAAEVWRSLRTARAQVARTPFENIIARLRARKARRVSSSHDVEALKLWAARFEAARRGAPIDAVCLQDSLALLEIYARRNLYPELVLGVTVAPFAAHCWLQAGGLILNEALDEAAPFQPILVV